MESVAPPLDLLLFVKASILKGISIHEAIESYLVKEFDLQFKKNIKEWFELISSAEEASRVIRRVKSTYRQALLEILEIGLEGHPILEKLEKLEVGMSRAIDEELESHIRKMPIYSLFPLLFLQLPSLMILGFLPFLQKFSETIGS